jgi:hypothetical protein
MRTLSLDILEKAELPPAQAHAILKVMEMEMTAAQETLATKADIAMLRFELKSEMAEIRSELRSEIAGVRSDLLIQMKSLEARMARWVLTCILGQTAILAGFGYFALTHLHR